MTRRSGTRSSSTNRDRRDQAFARSVIAEATRRHNATVDDRMNTLDDREIERCIYCSAALSGNIEIRDNTWPYCSVTCSINAENDDATAD
jgi:hypothetical protein